MVRLGWPRATPIHIVAEILAEDDGVEDVMRCVLITPELALPVLLLPCRVTNCVPGCLSQELPYSSTSSPPRVLFHTQSVYSLQQISHVDTIIGSLYLVIRPSPSSHISSFHLARYPPLSCLGYWVWKSHQHHPLPDCHHALWPNCPTSATYTLSSKRLCVLRAGEETTVPSHLWIAIRPVPPVQTSPAQTMCVACQ